MIISWAPVIWVDIFGSAITLIFALSCVRYSWRLASKKKGDTFQYYIFLLTISFLCFAISRPFGHLVKQILIMNNMQDIWQQIAPYSGSINTATFIAAFAFSLYFFRSYKVHLELEMHKNQLEELVKKRTAELATKNIELQKAITEVNVLSGLLPICASCKKIRGDDGYWNQIEVFIRDHSEADFSHGICPECAHKLYPELMNNKDS